MTQVDELSQDSIDKMHIVLCEMVSNAIKANETTDNFFVSISITVGKMLCLSVTDCGGGFHASEFRFQPMPESVSQSGRGIPLMEANCDYLLFSRVGKGTRVTAIWK